MTISLERISEANLGSESANPRRRQEWLVTQLMPCDMEVR